MTTDNDLPPSGSRATKPLTMEMYRSDAFQRSVRLQLQKGKAEEKTPEQIVREIADEQQAIATTITAPQFIDAASAALLQAQKDVTPNPRYQTELSHIREAMFQIMHRRAAEATSFAQKVQDPSYYSPLVGHASADTALPLSLHDVKTQEVLEDLLHLDAAGAPQVIAHIDATAKGMMIEHDALAMIFAHNGALYKPLTEGLAAQLPAASKSRIEALALEWLSQREAAAKLSADLAAGDGKPYLEAIRQSTQWHRQRLHAPPSTVVQTHGLIRHKGPEQVEKEKTALERAEDISYTINHALSCGTADVFLQPIIAATFGANVGCSHHDDHHGAHHHHEPKPKMTLKSFAHEAGHYFKGEIIGDFAAVPLTIGVQRFFPNFMNGLRKVTEPLVGWAFRIGANHSARNWAKQEGISTDAPEVAARAEAIYQHEVSHLPQAVMWNVFAYPIGAVAQKMGGHGRTYPEIFKSKLVGAFVSNGLLIGGRILSPGAAQKWDQAMGEKVFMPVSKKVGSLLNIDEATMEDAVNKQRGKTDWKERIQTEAHQSPDTARA